MTTASNATTEYYSAVLPPCDLEKNVVAKEVLPISPTGIRYYTVNAVGTSSGSGSPANSGVVFNIYPPSSDSVMSRLIRIRMTLKVTVRGTLKQGIAQPNNDNPIRLINSAYTGFCALPLNSMFSTVTLSINNASSTIKSSAVIKDLMRFDNPERLIKGSMSESPSIQDNVVDYAMITNFLSSPFGSYGDFEFSRNSYSITFDAAGNPNAQVYGTANPSSATFYATFVEPLIVPPLIYTEDWFHYTGFGQLDNVTVNITIDTNEIKRVFRQARNDYVIWTEGPTVTIEGTPQLIVGWYTLNPLQKIPPVLSYRYTNITHFATLKDQPLQQPTTTPIAFQITSSAIQLPSIPRAVIISVTKATRTYQDSDCYFPFGKGSDDNVDGTNKPGVIDITFSNQSGILSTASAHDLYLISRKNGLNMSWPQFSGQPIRYANLFPTAVVPDTSLYQLNIGNNNPAIGFIGSGGPIMLLFGVDIPLSADDYVGKQGVYSFQVTVSCLNNLINSSNAAANGRVLPLNTANDKAVLNLIFIHDGWMRMDNHNVVLDLHVPEGYVPTTLPRMAYPPIDALMRGGGLQGGSLFGTLGKLISNIPIVGDILGGLFPSDEDDYAAAAPPANPYAAYANPYAMVPPQYMHPPAALPAAVPAPKKSAAKAPASTGSGRWKRYLK